MSEGVGQSARERITEEASRRLRQEIVEAGGREVFFAGALNGDGLVHEVRVVSRGHGSAVPAFPEAAGPREVVLHNHPSGDLEPSDADLQLSSIFGHQGNGVYIVDSDVTRVYVVVEPFLHKPKQTVDPGRLANAFAPGSALSRLLPQFEVRPQQVRMMEAIARAFNDDGIAVVEAPTGVGKTMAYLVPAVQWAVQNRERVVISTRTINLQEQIIFKDIPLLAKCVKKPFTAVLVKGRHNYLCLRKLQRGLSEAELFEDESQRQTLRAIAEWSEKTTDGSLSDLAFVPPRELWESICSEADTCSLQQCPCAAKCFVGRARREVAKADLLIVNHHMLFSDIAIKAEMGNFSAMAVLPAYHRVIFDEAHSVEDSATEYFGVEATRNGSLALISRFIRPERGQERGLLPYLKMKLIKERSSIMDEQLNQALDLIDNELLPALATAREGLTTAFAAIRSLAAERCGQIGRDIQWRLTPNILSEPALRDLHAVYVLPTVDDVTACAKLCTKLHEYLKAVERLPDQNELPFAMEMLQLLAYRDRLLRAASVLAEGTSDTLQPNTVRWIEIDAQNDRLVRLARCPLEVAEPMAKFVFNNLKTLAMTSATLSVRRQFDYFFSRIGLDRVTDRTVETLVLDSPFDYQSQALLCIPKDIPAPDDKEFLEEAVGLIREALAITKGHALVLCTSFYALDFAFKRVEPNLKQAGIAALKQGMAARTHLLNRFREDVSSVLFATDSFWEGVDVAGDALQCVILPKLPFRVPTEPIQEARAEAIDLGGGNAFMEYVVPQAVIKFRQGFGRLIRRKSDSGAILVLDRRIVTKFYGKVFLESLPGMRIVTGPRRTVFAALREFFDRKHGGQDEARHTN
ncbi:MAG: DEAD/DEAH box helicase [Candidatus Hydrogenedentes bacterium]|nr:DEAD/DEAH box helicase [Candidatus Hydrogenedentota bacterium]